MARLFVAVWPPPEVAELLRSLPRKNARGVRFVPPENWHVTLRFLGDAEPDTVMHALDHVVLRPTRAALGPAVDVLGQRNLVVPVGGLDSLAEEVRRTTDGLGDAKTPPRFRGHLTLARTKKGARMPPALGSLVSAEWPVTEIALVLSRLEPDGARYETVGSRPLPGQPAGSNASE